MIERAAKAFAEADVRGTETRTGATTETRLRAALLAALDVEDEAILNAMAKQMAVDCLMPPKPGELDVRLTADVWSDYLSEARAALKALRSLAQGD